MFSLMGDTILVMSLPALIDTRKVAQRRALHFETLDGVLADAAALATAEQRNSLRQLGNWTLGQICNHLAAWVHYGFEGAPFTPPWFIRLVARPMKRRFLEKGLPAGARIPKVPGGTHGIDLVSTQEGIARLTKAFDRLKAGPPAIPNSVFGPLTSEEWTMLHLRHAELHLSFLRAD